MPIGRRWIRYVTLREDVDGLQQSSGSLGGMGRVNKWAASWGDRHARIVTAYQLPDAVAALCFGCRGLPS